MFIFVSHENLLFPYYHERKKDNFKWVGVRQWSLTGDSFYLPGDIGQLLKTFMVVTTLGWGSEGWVLLTSAGQRPGMLLNILQYTGHPPLIKNYSAPNVIGVKVEEPQMRDCKRSIHTQKKCLVINKHRLKFSISVAVNEMQCFSIKLTGVLKDYNTQMKQVFLY